MKGFTLIEVLVSVAIFSVVMVIALGALLAISVSDRKAESIKSVINNLNFAVDSMSRSIRTGGGWSCGAGGDCNNPGNNSFNFIPSTGVGRTYYRLESIVNDAANAASVCGQKSPNIGCIVKSTDGVNWLPVTSPEVVITDFSSSNSFLFYVVGSAAGSDPVIGPTQPKLVMTLSGYVKVAGGATAQSGTGGCGSAGNQCSIFRLQTTVTQRIYDQ